MNRQEATLTNSHKEDKIGVKHLVSQVKTTPLETKTISFQGYPEQEEPQEVEMGIDSLVLHKKRKLLDRRSWDGHDETERSLRGVLSDAQFESVQQMEVNYATRIDRMKEQLNQFQSHTILLEKELEETRKEIKILSSNAGDFANLHATGQCECQKYLSSHLVYTHEKSAIPQEESLAQLSRNRKTRTIFAETQKDSFLYHSLSEVSKPNGRHENAACMNSNIEKHNMQNRSAVKGNLKGRAKTVFQEPSKEKSSRYWTAEEHKRFLEALSQFGRKDLKALSDHVGTRSVIQCRTHMQKYFLRLMRESSN
ncbi:Myb-like protein I [Galdieria sulphuraria]|uniref:Myb domain-containing protein n=1 Tax=Galdieria sulphuraria TaxID=130081 RepID=M2XJC6_GALSU|nr:myb domain-containing protein [Galdieria sulphuraria]EME30217.1 myb domain-containing protein [Galdieria sulphuraria]GJD08385.1 Myb-like protein I [Galdieria sulphuraria]|eukprot:XP_005706737.1 myb domain-containing protein [Galdieria sulphuraria]